MAGVSRQAISAWFRQAKKEQVSEVNVKTRHLLAIARGLGVSADLLLEPLPGLSEEQRARLHAELLWDGLYDNLDLFLLGLARTESRAMARLVERLGLFKAAKIATDEIWRRFAAYKKYIHPANRKGLERLWKLKTSQASS